MISARDAYYAEAKVRHRIETADLKEIESAILEAVDNGEFECRIYKPIMRATREALVLA